MTKWKSHCLRRVAGPIEDLAGVGAVAGGHCRPSVVEFFRRDRAIVARFRTNKLEAGRFAVVCQSWK